MSQCTGTCTQTVSRKSWICKSRDNLLFNKNLFNFARITANDIKLRYLKHIFKGESDEALTALREKRAESKWDKDYEHDLLMAFWLAIHKEDVLVAQQLIDFDPTLRYLTVLAINGK